MSKEQDARASGGYKRPPRLNQPGTTGDDSVRVQANISRRKHRIWKGWAYAHGLTMKEMLEQAIEEKIERITPDMRRLGLHEDDD